MSTLESTHVHAVEAFYTKIDAQDVTGALACFAETAVYRRPGFGEFAGLTAIEEFYRSARDVGDGQHLVDAVIDDGNEIAIRGRFEGFYRDGTPLQVQFADFWRFLDGRVVERNSYLFQNDGRLI